MTASIAGVDVKIVLSLFEEAFVVGGVGLGDVCVEFIGHDPGMEMMVKSAFLLEMKSGGCLHGSACVGFFQFKGNRGLCSVGGLSFGV